MTGSSSLCLGSSIRLYPGFKFLAWTEGHDTASRNRNFLSCFSIATGALSLIAQIKVTEPRELDLFVELQRLADLLKEQLHQLLGFPFIQAQLFIQTFRHLSFRQSPHTLLP